MDLTQIGIGTGIYSVADAARLLQMKRSEITYYIKHVCENVHNTASKEYSIKGNAGGRYINFFMLMELRMVKMLRYEKKLSVQKIYTARKAFASQSIPFPFATRNIKHDGKDLYTEIAECMVKGHDMQIMIKNAMVAYLEDVTYSSSGLAEMYYPLGKNVPIVINPKVMYGQPVIKGTRLPAESIIGTLESLGHDYNQVIEFYPQIKKRDIQACEEFMKKLAA